MGEAEPSSVKHVSEQSRKGSFITLLKKEVLDMNTRITREAREELDTCPYCDAKADVCKASVTSLKIGALVRFKRCNSESYDNCALFLAKCLRSRWQFSYGV